MLYEYDSQGNLVRTLYKNASDRYFAKQEYELDEQGRSKKRKEYWLGSEEQDIGADDHMELPLTGYAIYDYDEKGHLISEIFYNSDDQATGTINHESY